MGVSQAPGPVGYLPLAGNDSSQDRLNEGLALEGEGAPGSGTYETLTHASATYSKGMSLIAAGAAGNGSTDDTAIINSTLTAAVTAGVPVIFDAGKTFKASSGDIVVPSGVEIRGHGSTLDIPSDGTAAGRKLYLNGVNGVKIRGLTISCSNAATRTQTYGIITIFSGTNILLEDVTVTGSEGCGIFTGTTGVTVVTGVSGLRIVRPTVHDTKADGIHVSRGASDVWITEPNVYTTADDAIAINSIQTDDGTHNYNQIDGVHIIFPKITNVTASGCGIKLLGPKNTEVVGGYINGVAADGVQVHTAGGGNGSTTYTATDIVLSDITVTAATVIGFLLATCTDVKMSNCNGHNNGDTGIEINGSTRAHVVGGSFHNNTTFGVYSPAATSCNLMCVDLHGNGTASNVVAGCVLTNCITV